MPLTNASSCRIRISLYRTLPVTTPLRMFPTAAFLTTAMLLAFAPSSKGAMTVDQFQITSNSIQFHVSGTLAGPPSLANDVFYIVNNNANASPGFVLADFVNAVTYSFTGSQTLSMARTGTPMFGDYLFFVFATPLASGDVIDGIFTATWSSTVFNPTAATGGTKLYWGTENFDEDSVTSGVLLGDVSTVPEPSGVMLGAIALAMVAGRRKR